MGGHDDKPWLSEPLEHLFESHGFVCFARRRTEIDTWCGYIYIPMTHPLFGIHYDDAELTVHGGLTYSDREGEAWCFGFDCAHYMDLRPDSKMFYDELDNNPFADATWKSLDFVINELDYLAKQLKEKEK
jgi:hypothetical protein